ncbi:carbohydrate-binding family 9-like protein [Cerasicoccus frondis]|uniref:carbohydrate-binding family 9-like protein n=1 Tax=Cerasicoccus frondis TaxID=490090 RepID=UPI0028527585|nr:carbohydrate-binding family 9-like protein [Cerasicoccus frondis]
MKSTIIYITLWGSIAHAIFLTGCSHHTAIPDNAAGLPAPQEIKALYVPEGTRIDGILDDAIWADAPIYQMHVSMDREAAGKHLAQGGQVQFAWNEEYLFVGVNFIDSDVVAEGSKNGEQHFRLGDVAEIFLWPEDNTWYWELYATPAELQSAYFYPGPGRLGVPSSFEHIMELEVSAQVDGTLNQWPGKDQSWTAEVAIPVSALTERSEQWGPDSNWRVLIGRYNYSAELPRVEHSALIPLSKTSFHLREEYGQLKLLPPGDQAHSK